MRSGAAVARGVIVKASTAATDTAAARRFNGVFMMGNSQVGRVASWKRPQPGQLDTTRQ
jgi:hypothetical protein